MIEKVLEVKSTGYVIENSDKLNNGDDSYFINELGEAEGAQINTITNNVVIPNSFKSIKVGTLIYRNADVEFNKLVEREDSVIRKISVQLTFSETNTGFQLKATDEDGYENISTLEFKKEVSKNVEGLIEKIKKDVSKTRNTPFIADRIEIKFSSNWFLLISKINEIRKKVLERLMDVRVHA